MNHKRFTSELSNAGTLRSEAYDRTTSPPAAVGELRRPRACGVRTCALRGAAPPRGFAVATRMRAQAKRVAFFALFAALACGVMAASGGAELPAPAAEPQAAELWCVRAGGGGW